MVAVDAKRIIDSLPAGMVKTLTFNSKSVRAGRAELEADHVNGLYGEANDYSFSVRYVTAELKGAAITVAETNERLTYDGVDYLILGVGFDNFNLTTRVDLGDKYA